MKKNSLNIGDTIDYMARFGKKRSGVIHGIRKADGPDGQEQIISYLVDTGDDFRVDRFTRNPRDEEVARRYTAEHNKNPKLRDSPVDDQMEVLNSIVNSSDLPPSKTIEVKVRQPKQVEVLPKDIIL